MTLQGHPGNRVALFASWGPHGQDGHCSRGVAFAAAPRPFVLLRAGPPVWDRPKRWYHPLDRGDVAQLGERGVRNAEVGSSILLVSTIPIHAPDPSKGWAFLLAGSWPDDADGAGRAFHLGQLFGISERLLLGDVSGAHGSHHWAGVHPDIQKEGVVHTDCSARALEVDP